MPPTSRPLSSPAKILRRRSALKPAHLTSCPPYHAVVRPHISYSSQHRPAVVDDLGRTIGLNTSSPDLPAPFQVVRKTFYKPLGSPCPVDALPSTGLSGVVVAAVR
jgi:hypothetical protein